MRQTLCPQSIKIKAEYILMLHNRGVINGEADKAAALPQISDTLILSESDGRSCPTIAFASPKYFRYYALA